MGDPEQIFGKKSTILITGASSGIGAALALHLASYGARLALMARRHDRLEQVAQDVKEAGGQPLILVGDVTDLNAVAEAHRKVLEGFGPVSVAFLNAGVGGETRVDDFSAAEVKTIFDVNVMGIANWLEVLLPSMLEQKEARLVAISSLAGARGLPGSAAYCGSKAAVSAMLESLQVDTVKRELKISIVEPGFVRSEITARNKFPMPFIMDGESAARVICDGVAEGQPWIRFPWPLAAAVRVLRYLPAGLYKHVGGSLAGQRSPKRADEGNEP